MAPSSMIDQVSFLIQSGKTLMSRLYYFETQDVFTKAIVSQDTNQLTDHHLGKLIKVFSKHFPDEPASNQLNKLCPSFQKDHELHRRVKSEVEEFYHTMVNVYEFHQLSIPLLHRIFRDLSTLTIVTHPTLVQTIFQFFTTFVKVHLVWTHRSYDVKGWIGIYGYCFRRRCELLLEDEEPHYDSLSAFIPNYHAFPLKSIQTEFCGATAEKIMDMASSLLEVYKRSQDLALLRTQNCFDPEVILAGMSQDKAQVSAVGVFRSIYSYERTNVMGSRRIWTLHFAATACENGLSIHVYVVWVCMKPTWL